MRRLDLDAIEAAATPDGPTVPGHHPDLRVEVRDLVAYVRELQLERREAIEQTGKYARAALRATHIGMVTAWSCAAHSTALLRSAVVVIWERERLEALELHFVQNADAAMRAVEREP